MDKAGFGRSDAAHAHRQNAPDSAASPAHDTASRIERDAIVWVLAAFCQYFRIPLDQKHLLSELPPEPNWPHLLRAAEALGFIARRSQASMREVARMQTPFAVLLNPSPAREEPDQSQPQAATDPASVAPVFAVVVKIDADRVAFVEQGETSRRILPLSDFSARYAGTVLRAAPREKKLSDPDLPGAQESKFGFRWFAAELFKHRRIFRDVLLASLVIQLMALATPLFTQVVIDKVIVHHTVNTLVVIGVALAVFMIFTAVLSWVRQYLILHTGNRIDAVLGTQVFEHLLRLPPRYFERRPTGVLIARIHGVETIRQFLASAAVALLLDLPFMGIFLAIMIWYSWQLTLIAVTVLTVIVILSLCVAPVIRRRLNEQFLLGARNQAFLTEYIAGMQTVKSLQMENQLDERFGGYLSSYLRASFKARQLGNTYQVSAQTLEHLLTLSILCAGAWLVMQNVGFTIGMLVAFQMFATRLSQPMLKLVGLWQEFQQAAIAVERLGDVMNAPREPYTLLSSRENVRRGHIEIQDLGFRYAENLPWLYRHFNLAIEPGECVAITGPSGCGKSTLAKLLQGFYAPNEGNIKIDGRDLQHLSANELRGHLGVVPQETVLFSGTLYDNIMMGNPLGHFDEMVLACKAAGIHDVIEALPQGYQTEIGEHGVGLSGGQMQRIAIARALLKRPPILVFDEATSNLDEDTANAFGETINALMGKTTIILIAHKLPASIRDIRTISLADQKGT